MVRALRAQAAVGVLRSACDQILTRLPATASAYVSRLLAGAASGGRLRTPRVPG